MKYDDLNQMINNIDNRLEELKQEELEGKLPEEQEKINEQWNKEEKEFGDITNSVINGFKEGKTNAVNQEILIEVPDLLKGFISFDEDGYAFANQKLPNELKNDYNDFINNYYLNDNNKVVNNIVNKICEMPYNTETTIAQLINYKPEVAFVSPLTQGIIRNAVNNKCKNNNIILQRTEDSFGGLAYYSRFKKVNNNY